MSEAEFDQLVERIASIEIKYALRRSEDMFSHVERAARVARDEESAPA